VSVYSVFICRSGSAVLHFDSTGSVMKRMPEHKQPHYYTLLAAQDSMPVCEFLTTCHRHAWIMTILDQFLNDVATLNSGRRTTPRTVDMVCAVLLAFSRLTLDAYLETSWAVAQGKRALSCTALAYIKQCSELSVRTPEATSFNGELLGLTECSLRNSSFCWK